VKNSFPTKIEFLFPGEKGWGEAYWIDEDFHTVFFKYNFILNGYKKRFS